MFGIVRRVLLAASASAWLRDRTAKTAFVRRSVSAIMPGERLEDAMAAASALSSRGITALLTRLGENLTSEEDADAITRHYLEALDRIESARLPAQISVKPTQLGLDLGPEICFENLQRIVDRAHATGNFVWIDMEGSAYVDRTLDLFRRTRPRSPRVGLALQAYLRRTEADLESLLPLAPSIRLVKGAYLEPPSAAFTKRADVDGNFYRLACRLLRDDVRQSGSVLQIATHDERLVTRLEAFIDGHQVPSTACEFAMLYGIQRALQHRLADGGRPVRVLISYGDYWFPWYMRRLAERPANLWFVVRNIFR